ncbi:hypothetical protein GCM10027562_24490 [Arthrobacter pigmenti]
MVRLLQIWFGPKRFEKGGAVYEKFGVDRFSRFLPFGYWTNRLIRALGAKNFRIINDESSAKIWVVFTMVVEFCHVVAFGLFAWFMVCDLLQADYAGAAWNGLLNLLVNVYPSMVQRYNRIRILQAFKLDLKEMQQWDIQM